jgi:hypothetical protein
VNFVNLALDAAEPALYLVAESVKAGFEGIDLSDVRAVRVDLTTKVCDLRSHDGPHAAHASNEDRKLYEQIEGERHCHGPTLEDSAPSFPII